jgi:hypothetical protein
MMKLAAQQLGDGVSLPVASIFEALSLSRATYYRHQLSTPAPDPDIQLRDHIQRIALDVVAIWLPTHHGRASPPGTGS